MYDPQSMLVGQRIQTLREEAQRHHLARQIRRPRTPAFRSVTRAVGLQLIAWGEQLQDSSAAPRRRTLTTS